MAVVAKMPCTVLGLRSGLTDQIRAATPETIGVASEVPLDEPNLSSRRGVEMLTHGPARSMNSQKDEKPARLQVDLELVRIPGGDLSLDRLAGLELLRPLRG